METENKYDEVLIRFLLNESNAEDDLFVKEWVSKSEDNRLHLNHLAHTLKLVAVNEDVSHINIEAEWQHFQQQRSTAVHHPLKAVNELPVETIEEIPVNRNAKIIRLLFSGAVAASVILLLLFKFGMFDGNKQDQLAAAKQTDQSDTLHEVLVHEINSTLEIRDFLLPDGSFIHLYPKGELTYREPSDQKSRLVSVSGKASFEVAKDKTRPFTVYSGPINTTALGTVFTISAIPNEKHIYVRLNEGKVVVKAGDNTSNVKMQDVYLVPGEEFVYDIGKRTGKVRLFEKSVINNNDKVVNENPAIPGGNKKPWFMFNNQSLGSIFKTLENMYEAKINYSSQDIDRLYFIGTFSKADSLEFILNQIAKINNLEVIRESNTYTIKKK